MWFFMYKGKHNITYNFSTKLCQDEAKHDDGNDSPISAVSGKGSLDSGSFSFYQPNLLTER